MLSRFDLKQTVLGWWKCFRGLAAQMHRAACQR